MSTPSSFADSARARLAQLRLRAESVASRRVPAPSELSPGAAVHSEILGTLGGVLGGELFGKKRAGQTLGRSIARSSRDQERRRAIDALRQEALQVAQDTETELFNLSGAIPETQRQTLIRAVREARLSTRHATIGARCLRVIERANSILADPPRIQPNRSASPSAIHSEAYGVLRSLERQLREFIQDELSSRNPKWWAELVPESVRKRAEHRMSQREPNWPWIIDGETNPIHFVDFKDYAVIITEERNWVVCFERVFVDRDSVRIKLKELEPIRIDLAHSRTLTQHGAAKLRLYSAELTSRMHRPK